MSAYVCWDPENEDDPGETPHECFIIGDAYDAESAAEEYAERCWNDDPFAKATIMVRDSDGVVKRFEVTVDYSPTFYGSEVES